MATAEWETKWPQFMPRGAHKNHPTYGWEVKRDNTGIKFIKFNSGVYVYFKTYAQDVMTLQTGTCDAIFCFEGHTPISTADGIRTIAELDVGCYVFSQSGSLNRVDKIYSRRATSIRRLLSNGEFIDATPDHRIWVDHYGWKPLSTLTPKDSLGKQKEWQKKRLLNLVERSIRATQRVHGNNTNTSKGIAQAIIAIYILRSIKSFVEKSLLILWFTIKMKTQRTIRLIIWPLYRRLSTRACIKNESGPLGSSGSANIKSAFTAEPISQLEPPKKLQQKFVLNGVGEYLREQLKSVFFAVKYLFSPLTQCNTFVLDGALPRGEREVFCLNVNKEHNFQVCGIIGKNCDEELPEEHYNELIFRISASNGYFHMVFTATLGQDFWRRCMEPSSKEEEALPHARKWCVSLYECKEYEDGTPSIWTDKRIQEVKDRCLNEKEVLKRVYGRFVYEGGGRKFEHFDIKRHMQAPHFLPKSWFIYAGVDIGTGGENNHPAAIAFVGVSPDHTKGRVFLCWRGDKEETTAGDILEKYNQMVLDHKLTITACFYDWASRDFELIQQRAGGSFQKADKSHETGEHMLNTLFKNNRLLIYDNDELQKLATELTTLKNSTNKRKAKDDLIDALRYAVTKIPWNWEDIAGVPQEIEQPKMKLMTAEEELAHQIDERRKLFKTENDNENQRIEDEIAEWNQAYDGY